MGIFAIVGAGLVGILMFWFNMTLATTNAATLSTDSQALARYFVPDISSMTLPSFTSQSPSCTPFTDYPLTWTATTGGPTHTYKADYQVVGSTLVRIFTVDRDDPVHEHDHHSCRPRLEGGFCRRRDGDRADPLRHLARDEHDGDDPHDDGDDLPSRDLSADIGGSAAERRSIPTPSPVQPRRRHHRFPGLISVLRRPGPYSLYGTYLDNVSGSTIVSVQYLYCGISVTTCARRVAIAPAFPAPGYDAPDEAASGADPPYPPYSLILDFGPGGDFPGTNPADATYTIEAKVIYTVGPTAPGVTASVLTTWTPGSSTPSRRLSP